jgi:transcription elongation factor Elf1
MHEPCPKCKTNRWKTTLKSNKHRVIVSCRKCGEKRKLIDSVPFYEITKFVDKVL